MNAYAIITNIIGAIASVLTIYSFQRKTGRQIYTTQILYTVLWVVHFVMIDALAGALMNLCNCVKAIAIVYLPVRHIKFFPIFYLTTIWAIFYVFVYQHPMDLLPIISGTIGAFLIYYRDNRYIIARASLVGASMWIGYAILTGSIPALITDSFVLLSVIIGMIRHEEKPFKFFRIHP